MPSSSIKSTFPLFESICIVDGKIQNEAFHTQRFEHSFKKFYWQEPRYALFDSLVLPREYQKGKVKLRISYGKDGKTVSFQTYQEKRFGRLKMVFDDEIDYDLKFEDRSHIKSLFEQKKDCDDILIIKNGKVTDTSYANIIFYDGDAWYTPKNCLLKGTKRAQLLDRGAIFEMQIGLENIPQFEGFQLINAMLDFDAKSHLPISNIIQ